jgi:hypothetical protein
LDEDGTTELVGLDPAVEPCPKRVRVHRALPNRRRRIPAADR